MNEWARRSTHNTLIIDESQDVGLQKVLLLYLRYLEDGVYVTKFWTALWVPKAECETLMRLIEDHFDDCGVEMTSIQGFASDGATVVCSKGEGVAGKIIEKSPGCVNCHCVAHRNNLAVKHACEGSRWASGFESKIVALLSYYSHSGNRRGTLEKLQEELQVKKLALLKVCKTRWLSRGNAVRRICTLIPCILLQLVRESAAGVELAATTLEKLLTHRFMAALMLIADILDDLNSLSNVFQRRDLRNTDVTEHVARVINKLERTYIHGETVSASTWRTFCDAVKTGTGAKYSYMGSPEIEFDKSADDEAIAEVKSFAESVVGQLNAYFPCNPIIDALDIFDIRSFPKTEDAWRSKEIDFGRDELRFLLRHYTTLGYLRAEDWPSILNEWNLLKADLFKVRQELSNNGTRPLKPAEETKAMSEFYKKMFEANAASSEEDNESTPLSPSIRFLVCAFLCIELSSVCCERGFSIMNRIKCKARNRMYVDTLDSLMMIALNGPMDKTAKKVLIEEACLRALGKFVPP